jgi:DNA-binding response OmpR family regulator
VVVSVGANDYMKKLSSFDELLDRIEITIKKKNNLQPVHRMT